MFQHLPVHVDLSKGTTPLSIMRCPFLDISLIWGYGTLADRLPGGGDSIGSAVRRTVRTAMNPPSLLGCSKHRTADGGTERQDWLMFGRLLSSGTWPHSL